MKKFLLLLNVSIMMVYSGCTGNQKSQTEQSYTISAVQTEATSIVETTSLKEDEAIIEFLKEFYIAYNRPWNRVDDFGVYLEQSDSLRQKYCTKKLRKEYIKAYKDGHDVLVSDLDTEDLETLSVVKDNTRENTYCVSYTTTEEMFGKKTIYKVQIRLLVVKENGHFKIDEVLNPFDGVQEIP